MRSTCLRLHGRTYAGVQEKMFALNASARLGLPSATKLRTTKSPFSLQRRNFSESRSHQQNFKQQRSQSTCSNVRDPGLAFTSVLSDPSEVPGPEGLPSRLEILRRLQRGETEYDVLVIGGGATGAGCALDAATRGLNVACIERGDFSSETSSRSTKLIWAGIKYMATATAALLSRQLLFHPVKTIKDFSSEMYMVLECHKERRYMAEQNKHLVHWIPIAIPFTTWHVSPPPFGHALFGYFPILAPIVLKFYDSLSGFTCPKSYILRREACRSVFPQLDHDKLKYCAVFYEAQHNDSRTNLCIALSAAYYGADICNYVEMTGVIRDGDKVIGVLALDRMTGQTFPIHAKRVVFCGGPFTDDLRSMEERKKDKDSEAEQMRPAVQGAAGTHIVLPGYYVPRNMGLLDYNTSDGRFLFILPWQNHTLIGTTDSKEPAVTLPGPPEQEIQWLLNEASKYLDVKLRRTDVLSAWRGWRPLAADPHAALNAQMSRDHVISENPRTGTIFVAGGKWTTWREMSEQVIDRIVGHEKGQKCKTLKIPLFGAEGYSEKLPVQLIQRYGMAQDVAEHLSQTYGGRAVEVAEIARQQPVPFSRLAQNFPYIDAEVVYACREYACTVEDVLSRRTRLAFLDKATALSVVPKVADIMAKELRWTEQVKQTQISTCQQYIASYGGRIPAGLRFPQGTFGDVDELFRALDIDGDGYLDVQEVSNVVAFLGLSAQDKSDLKNALTRMDVNGDSRISFESFRTWWTATKPEDCSFRSFLAQMMKTNHGVQNNDDAKHSQGASFLRR